MFVINARNVNHALPAGVNLLRECGVTRESRNGPVIVSPVPVTTVYAYPRERVLFSRLRDANPFFHLIESLWMLAGRDDLATLTPFVSRMKNFSDDGGKTQPGAYGKRWRNWFFTPGDERPIDQLAWAIKRLKNDPNDRRVIIQMYDASVDQHLADKGGKDIPCNIVVAPWIDADGRFSMTIFCRSNDIIWGAYGANAVHFSFLQEYLAAGIGVEMGAMYQVSNNFHAYVETLGNKIFAPWELYEQNVVHPSPLSLGNDFNPKQFDEDLTIFFDEPAAPDLRSAFLRRIACPMVLAHKAYRKKEDSMRFATAFEIIDQCPSSDWKRAGMDWLGRREAETNRAKDDGVQR